MLAILNYLNAHNFPILEPILMILVSKFMVHRDLSDKAYLSLGLLSPLSYHLPLRSLFCLFLSGHFTQVLLYFDVASILASSRDYGISRLAQKSKSWSAASCRTFASRVDKV